MQQAIDCIEKSDSSKFRLDICGKKRIIAALCQKINLLITLRVPLRRN